jgi:hypothetical protein
MTEEQRKAVDNIMDWFDFEKVHKTMKALRWEWMDAEEKIPCQGEIREKARQLLTEAIQTEMSIGTGGLQVTYIPVEGFLKLEFVVSEWDALI